MKRFKPVDLYSIKRFLDLRKVGEIINAAVEREIYLYIFIYIRVYFLGVETVKLLTPSTGGS